MPTDVVMPQMGESIFEGTITKWLKKPGDQVQRDEPLFEISTDKVDAEIPSPASGVLTEIKVAEGATVQINTVVAVIGEAGSAVSTSKPQAAAPPPAAAKPAAPAPPPQKSAAPAASTPSTGGTDVVMPQMGESIFEGTITKWLKKVGDNVQRDEPLFEISTDKVDAEIPAPASGKLTEIKVTEGNTVQINTVVAVIGGSATTAAAHPATAAAAAPSKSGEIEINTRKGAATVAAAPEDKVDALAAATAGPGHGDANGSQSSNARLRSSPLVRRIAKDNNLNLHSVKGTGSSGRITKDDIVSFLQQHGAGTSAPTPATHAAPQAAAPSSRPQAAPAVSLAAAPHPGDLVPMSKMRAIIAKRMSESKHTSAHVHSVFKVDMTRIVRIRERERAKFEQRNGIKLTYMPFITRACIKAIQAHPIVNSSVSGENIRYHRHINMGIAVALEWGLIVPVIREAEERSFIGIARAIVDLADRARNKKLKPDEVADGTFTLTNSGIFGEQFGTPIISQPQTAILGIGGLFKEPTVITADDGTDSIAVRHVQRFTLGFDHRIIDGADAGKFMADFKKYLENWPEELI
jgi:pyruvate dehydrogenase E2 component (dihydrolipoamide acetyltransferase)